LIEEVRKCTEDYERVFVFSFNNMRNSKLQEIKNEWKSSRFFFGKNKVIGVGLGRGPEDEIKDDIHKISERMRGQRGLLFTNNTKEEVLKYFNLYSEPDFARTGDTATETITLDKGPLNQFSYAMEPHLRQLGLTTKLEKGVIYLEKDETICEEGDTLTSDQSQLLKLLGIEMAEFKITIEACWSQDAHFEEIVPVEGKKRKRDAREGPTSAKKLKKSKKAAKVESEPEDEEEDAVQEDDEEEDEELEQN